MLDDYDWKVHVVDKCPLYIGELNREEVVEWVIEHTHADIGVLQVQYTRCDALPRPFVSAHVTSSVWSENEEGELSLFAIRDGFLSIGLAKRWASARQELWAIANANQQMSGKPSQTPLFDFEDDDDEDDEDGDWFGLG